MKGPLKLRINSPRTYSLVIAIYVVLCLSIGYIDSERRQLFYPLFSWNLFSRLRAENRFYDLKIKFKNEPAQFVRNIDRRKFPKPVLWHLTQRAGRQTDENCEPYQRLIGKFENYKSEIRYYLLQTIPRSRFESVELVVVNADFIKYINEGLFDERKFCASISL